MRVIHANMVEGWVLTSDDEVVPISWYGDWTGSPTVCVDDAFIVVCEWPVYGQYWFRVMEIPTWTIH